MKRFEIYRDQIGPSGSVIDTMRFVGVDCAGIPGFVTIRNRDIPPYIFQCSEWARINLLQCLKYSIGNGGVKFYFRLEEIADRYPSHENTMLLQRSNKETSTRFTKRLTATKGN